MVYFVERKLSLLGPLLTNQMSPYVDSLSRRNTIATMSTEPDKKVLVQIAVVYNSIPSLMTIHRGSAVVIPVAPRTYSTGGAPDAAGYVLSFNAIQQVLVSRKRPCQVRVILDGGDAAPPPVDALFESTIDRDVFMAALATSTATNTNTAIPTGKPNEPASIKSEDVPSDVSLLGTNVSELDSASVVNEIKGAVHVFEAINGLIDVTTLKLRPVSEQLEMDILRQLPVVADIFLKRVQSEEDHRAFWEAVVKKFFCFTKSYLDLDFSTASANTTIAAQSTETTMAGQVNRAAAAALPLQVKAPKRDDHNRDEEYLGRVVSSEAGPPTRTVHQAMFLPQHRSSRRVKRERHDDAADEDRLMPAVARPHRSAIAQALQAPTVAPQLPSSARTPETIKALKQFWAAIGNDQSVDAIKATLTAQLPLLAHDSVMHRCVVAALAYSIAAK